MNSTQLVFILLSGIIGIPLLLVGETIGQGQSVAQAIVCCLVGNGLLTLLALSSSKKIIEYRCSTSSHMLHVLGKSGRAIMALLMLMSMLFWFCLQTQIIAHSFFPHSPPVVSCFIGFILSIATSKGLSMIEQASFWTTPCMLIAIGIALMSPSKDPTISSSISCTEKISIAIGGAILGVIDLPTFFQQAKSLSDVRKAIFISFFIAISLIECCGIVLAHKGISVTEALTRSPLSICPLIAACIANMSNLYSAAKSLESILKMNEKKAIILTGVLGSFLSQFPLFHNLADVLSAASAILIAFGSILICESFIHSSKKANWIALIVGLSVSMYELIMGVSVSKIPAVDVFIATATSLILTKGRKAYVYTNN